MRAGLWPQIVVSLMLFIISACAYARTDDRQQIEALIRSYEKAMNEGDAEQVISLYAKNGVFMPSGHLTAVGKKAIKIAYDQEFNAINLDVEIVIDEVTQHGDFAFVRSRSKGSLTILEGNKTVSTDSYRAFLVLQKITGDWKIARFMFNFTEAK